MSDRWKNQLHYGDNLEVLREKIPDGIVDLIYLDPPFNSSRNYNLLFKQQKGQDSPAQIMAFEDTWQWSHLEYSKFCSDQSNAPLHKLVASLREILGDTEMMAYVVMMAPRLLELHQKLKKTGTLYLHCDPVASHYLKIILDVIFGAASFRNEIIWKRHDAHGDAKQGSSHFGRIHDTLLLYGKGPDCIWNPQYTPYDEEFVRTYYKFVDETGRQYWTGDITAAKAGGDTKYEWRVKRRAGTKKWCADLDNEHLNPKGEWEYRGVPPPSSRYWAYSRARMQALESEGRIAYSESGMPKLKRYLDEMKGKPVQDIWDDIRGLGGLGAKVAERRGYPTQKPLALLERIIAASSNEGDLVLDPFAGCGTAIVAAERMNRRWIGIDITYLAINEIIDRLNTEKIAGKALNYELIGTPKDAGGAEQLFRDTEKQNHKPYEQFAVSLVQGKWNEKKGADRGVDGRIGMWNLSGSYCETIVQVKGGNALTLSAVRDFRGTIEREKAVMGFMISQKEPTKEMLKEAESLGFAEWNPANTYPRMQIRTMKDLLENPRKPFRFPEGSRIMPQQGVGKALDDKQMSLMEE